MIDINELRRQAQAASHPTTKGRRIRLYFMRTYRGSPGLNFHAGLNLPIIGSVSIQTQPNMPIKRTPKTEGAMK